MFDQHNAKYMFFHWMHVKGMCILLTAVVFAESIAALIYSIGTLGTMRAIIPAVFISITLIVIGCAVVGGVVAHKPKLLLMATVMQFMSLVCHIALALCLFMMAMYNADGLYDTLYGETERPEEPPARARCVLKAVLLTIVLCIAHSGLLTIWRRGYDYVDGIVAHERKTNGGDNAPMVEKQNTSTSDN